MRTFLALCAAAALIGAAGVATAANAPFIDKAGNCHAANGQMAKMSVCKPAPKAGGPCKDAKTGQFIACASVQKGPCKDPKTGQFMACASAKPATTVVAAKPATAAVPAKPATATMAAKPAVPAKPAAPAVPAKK
jgi:hypothetical protein